MPVWKDFSLLESSQANLEAVSLGVKWLVYESDYALPSSTTVRNEWSLAFIACPIFLL